MIVALTKFTYNETMPRLHTKMRKRGPLILGIILLLFLIGLVMTVPPDSIIVRILFFVLFFGATFYTAKYGFNQTRRALLLSSGLTLYIFIRFLHLFHWLYLVLICILVVALEVYSGKK